MRPFSNCQAISKDQIISKGLLVSSNSPKKRTHEFVVVVKTNSFVCYLGELEDTKSPFKIFWPLGIAWQFEKGLKFLSSDDFSTAKLKLLLLHSKLVFRW